MCEFTNWNGNKIASGCSVLRQRRERTQGIRVTRWNETRAQYSFRWDQRANWHLVNVFYRLTDHLISSDVWVWWTLTKMDPIKCPPTTRDICTEVLNQLKPQTEERKQKQKNNKTFKLSWSVFCLFNNIVIYLISEYCSVSLWVLGENVFTLALALALAEAKC